MRRIGLRGLRSFLEELGLWPEEGLRLAQAREVLGDQQFVKDKLTQIEQLCKDHNIVLLYEPKAHPFFQPVEVPRLSSGPSHTLEITRSSVISEMNSIFGNEGITC